MNAIGDAQILNANRLSINTYICIFPHNLCKIKVIKLVFDSLILS